MKSDGGQSLLNKTGALVAVSLIIIFGCSIGALVLHDVPTSNQNVLLVLLGALSANVTSMVGWFFGSSIGNKAKDDTIATMTDTASKVQGAGSTTTTTVKTESASVSPIVATVKTPDVEVPLEAGQKATVEAKP